MIVNLEIAGQVMATLIKTVVNDVLIFGSILAQSFGRFE
jgi:hypothetical protein